MTTPTLYTLQVQTEGNANSPGRERIKQLVQECFCLSAATAMVNPTGSLVFYSLKMDAQTPDGAADKPNPEYWAHIAVSTCVMTTAIASAIVAYCDAISSSFTYSVHEVTCMLGDT